jgi:uncharacterized protein (DUF1697 family)
VRRALIGQYAGMPTHIALLRGINVGGRSKVSMPDLRQVFESLGHTEVATYIQSGNVVFTPGGTGAQPGNAGLAVTLEQAIAAAMGVSPKVVVLTAGELEQVVRDNPFPDPANPRLLHAVFYATGTGPDPDVIAGAVRQVAARGSRDEAEVKGRTLYLHTPDGFGRSELANLLLARARGAAAAGTARNWATVTKLVSLCRA